MLHTKARSCIVARLYAKTQPIYECGAFERVERAIGRGTATGFNSWKDKENGTFSVKTQRPADMTRFRNGKSFCLMPEEIRNLV